MPNLAKFLKDEIARLSRKAVRSEFGSTRKQVAVYRREIAALKRTVTEQQRRIAFLEKAEKRRGTAGIVSPASSDERQSRFSPKWLRKHREKLGISAADYAKLVGVSGLTIYNWEHEKSRPRAAQIAKLAGVRTLGVREAQRRLEMLEGQG